MKNINLGIISLAAVIVFLMTGCDSGTGGNGDNNGANYSCQLPTGGCIQMSVSDCSQAGGSVVDFCQGQPSSSSNTPNGGASSSSQNTQISSSSVGTNPNINTSLDGIWTGDGRVITINGSIGTLTSNNDTYWQEAITKGYVKIGDQVLRSLTSTGTLTWSGQARYLTQNNNNPGVVAGTNWDNVTITMNADGTITVKFASSSASFTMTRSSPSLDGVWIYNNNISIIAEITVSGKSGTLTSFTSTSVGWTDAYNKGYINQWWRNLQSTGTLTWSGQQVWPQGSYTNPNICTGVDWPNITIVMSADGNTLTVSEKNADGIGDKWTQTYTRK